MGVLNNPKYSIICFEEGGKEWLAFYMFLLRYTIVFRSAEPIPRSTLAVTLKVKRILFEVC